LRFFRTSHLDFEFFQLTEIVIFREVVTTIISGAQTGYQGGQLHVLSSGVGVWVVFGGYIIVQLGYQTLWSTVSK
jgi:hypothetical protein